jgi:ParB family transcriptional regulator, chromosome partitioning protein
MAMKGLGRGLDALIPANDSVPAAQDASSGVITLAVDDISANPRQPRMTRGFDKTLLEELAASIKEHGVIQPLIVVRAQGGQTPFTLIAGERRWRASKLAGLATVPVIVKDYAPQQMLEVALIENVQRSDLSAIEEALAYNNLMTDFGLTHSDVARRVGKSRESVSNTVRLLELPNKLQQALLNDEISEGHARALGSPNLGLEQRLLIFEEIKKNKLSVRQTEELVRRVIAGAPQRANAKKQTWEGMRDLENKFRNALGTKVQLQRSRKGGKIVIDFYSDEEFNALYEKIVGAD